MNRLITIIALTLLSFNVSAFCNQQRTNLDYLSCAIYFESGNQDVRAMALTGNVILNRVHNDKFPDSLKEVLTQKSQFSYWRKKDLTVHYKAEYSTAFYVALRLLIADYLDIRNDISDNAVFFHTKAVKKGCRFGTKLVKFYGEHYYCKF